MARVVYPLTWARALLECEYLTRAEKLVGVGLHVHMDKLGVCSPGLTKLAVYAGCTERHVRRVLRELERCGWITCSPRTGTSNRYAGLIPPRTSRRPPTPDIQMSPEESREEEKPLADDLVGGF